MADRSVAILTAVLASWGVLGRSSARDGCEFVTERARGFSPPSRRDKSDQSDPTRRVTRTKAVEQRRDLKRGFWGGGSLWSRCLSLVGHGL